MWGLHEYWAATGETTAREAADVLKEEDGLETEEAPDLDALMEEFRIISEKHAAGELESEEFEERRDEILMQLGVE